MGKVFSPEEVDSGAVPEIGAHYLAADHILEMVWGGQRMLPGIPTLESPDFPQRPEHGIESLLVYGSTALGTANRRSDLDVAIVYDTFARQPLTFCKGIFEQVSREYRIPIETSAHPIGALGNGLRHTIDFSFASHLHKMDAESSWRFGKPVWPNWERQSSDTTIDRLLPATVAYVANKRKSFAGAVLEDNRKPDYKRLQRAFEIPAAIGRKIVMLYYSSGQEEVDPTNKGQAAGFVLAKMTEIADNSRRIEPDTIGKFSALCDKNDYYTQLLEQTVAGQTSLSEYKEWLQENYLAAYDSAHDTCLFWEQVLAEALTLRRTSDDSDISFGDQLLSATFNYY